MTPTGTEELKSTAFMLLARNINIFDVKIMPKVKLGRVNIWCRFKSIKSKYFKKFTLKIQ